MGSRGGAVNAQGYAMATPNEVEIKLRLDPNKMQRLERWGGLAGADASNKNFHTVYFDDEKRHLLKNGYELRVRQDGGRCVQTLKTIGSIDRGEWQNETTDGEPSLESVEGPGLARASGIACGSKRRSCATCSDF